MVHGTCAWCMVQEFAHRPTGSRSLIWCRMMSVRPKHERLNTCTCDYICRTWQKPLAADHAENVYAVGAVCSTRYPRMTSCNGQLLSLLRHTGRVKQARIWLGVRRVVCDLDPDNLTANQPFPPPYCILLVVNRIRLYIGLFSAVQITNCPEAFGASCRLKVVSAAT